MKARRAFRNAWFTNRRKRHAVPEEAFVNVAWVKVERRLRVFLGSIFRVRAFWGQCHLGIRMLVIRVDLSVSDWTKCIAPRREHNVPRS